VKIDPADLAVLAAYLAAMLAFGLWMGRRQRDAADFMLGGRSMPWWLVLASIVATETSTVTLLRIPVCGWQRDLTWIPLPLGYALGRLVVIAVLLPAYFRGEMFTAYQVLHERFGGPTKTVASSLFLVTRTLADGLRLYLSAIVLEKVAGLDMVTAIVVLGIVTIAYTFLGGMRAVVWTDLVQLVVYLAGAALAFGILIGGIEGGLAGFLDRAGEAGKLHAIDTGHVPPLGFLVDFANPYQLWAGVIGGAVLSVASHGVDQLMVQRYLCARSQRHAAVALGLSGVVVILQFGFFLLIGAALFLHYEVAGRSFAKPDEVFASFIVEEIPTPVLGIVLGAVFSAAMSTLSSSLNSSATALASDIWFPLLRRGAGERERLRTVRGFTVQFGLLQIAVGIAGRDQERSVVNGVLAVAGFTTGIILGVFLLGTWSRVGQRAALTGIVIGTAVVSWVAFGTPVAWPWYALVGSSTTLAAGLAADRLVRAIPSR